MTLAGSGTRGMRKFDRIQILRFAAAAAVVIFHSLGTCQKYFSGETSLGQFTHGDLGVDLFFVISGFIITLTADTREQTAGVFLLRRLERIVPLYWLATVLMFGLLLILYRSTPEAPDLGYLLRSLFYVSWVGEKLPVVFPGWTLEYELAFYLVVATAMAASPRKWHWTISMLAILVTIGVGARWLGVISSHLSFLTDPMYLEFVFGIGVAHLIRGQRLPLIPCAFAAAACLLLAIQWPWYERTWRVVIAGMPAALVVWYAAQLDRSAIPLSSVGRGCARLGDASYSIYLTQVFSISILCKIVQFSMPRLHVDVAILAVSVMSIVIAYAVHHLVERPITRALHARDGASRAVSVGRVS